jgi:hypothetical protein
VWRSGKAAHEVIRKAFASLSEAEKQVALSELDKDHQIYVK